MYMNPLNDSGNIREHRNLTNSQRKKNISTKEGVVVNSLVKENENIQDLNLSETKDSFVISDNVPLPKNLYEDSNIVDKKLLPLSGIALGVMSSLAIVTEFVKRSAKISKNLAKEKCLPPLTRNVNLNSEFSQVMYQMVQSPNKKTFLAGVGTLTLGAMALWDKLSLTDIKKFG